ncbi:hypothetical protein HELRODRAFT_162640 [Helobdella robusta]|uniref:Cadherin domain-containing protein n=1 Tax=Helobdella robusta TaxID=6412 RepID=T1ESY7_HELRO|nr:hypothetical protein HELRODRAFT_162640 [Helobdella robusta]ESN99145.1 hypothetical protein HELRODRAFT_162640 [Helobdella robusta]
MSYEELVADRMNKCTATKHIDEEKPAGSVIADIRSIILYNISQQAASKSNLKNLRYDFTSSPSKHEYYFKINHTSGLLSVNEKLDRDELCKPRGTLPRCIFSIVINVRQDNILHLLRTFITLNDVNDNAPKFDVREIHIDVSDDTRDRFTYNVPTAVDADSDKFGVDRYAVLEHSSDKLFLDMFELKTLKHQDGSMEIKLVVKQKLSENYKGAPHVKGTIVAYDKGRPSLSDLLHVMVKITMSSEVVPQFEKSSYHLYVDENTPIDTRVYQISAVAPDNSSLLYYLQNDAPHYRILPFQIQPAYGYLTVNGSLDYETETYYTFYVFATVLSKSATSSKVAVSIVVNDLNDNAPHISISNINKNAKASINENSPVGTFISFISVTDKDSGDNKQTGCIAQSSHFKLESVSEEEYTLLSAEIFDREKISNYEVGIYCEDKGDPVLTSEVILEVNILDANDNVPLFAQNIYTISVKENSRPTHQHLTQINATDFDEHSNAQLTYSISSLSSSYANCLSIDILQGSIYQKCTFDFEKDETQQKYLIYAVDSGTPKLTGSTTLILNVEDVNDNKPTFTQSEYKFYVTREQLHKSSKIGTVEATDEDLVNDNKNIYYALASNVYEEVFNVEIFTGEISWKYPIFNQSEFVFNVTASNSYADPELRTLATVVVNIESPSNIKLLNQIRPNESIVFEGSVQIGDVIYQFNVSNKLLVAKKRFKFKIISGNEDNLFTVDNNKNQLIVISPLKHGLTEHNLTIQITDSSQNYKPTIINLPLILNNTSNYLPAFDAWTRNPENLLTIISTGVGFILLLLFIISVVLLKKKCSKKNSKVLCKTANHTCDTLSSAKEFKLVPNLYDSESLQKGMSIKQAESDRRKEVKFSLVQLDEHDDKQRGDSFYHNMGNYYKHSSTGVLEKFDQNILWSGQKIYNSSILCTKKEYIPKCQSINNGNLGCNWTM